MYRKFLLPMLVSLFGLDAIGQTTVIKADSNKVIIKTDESKTTIQVNDLSSILKNIQGLDFSEGKFEDAIMGIDTPPPTDSLWFTNPKKSETVEIKTITSDSGSYVEIIVKDETGKVTKITRINQDLLDEYGFDFEDGHFLNHGKNHIHHPAKRNKNIEEDWFSLDLGLNGLMYNGSPSLPAPLGNLELDPLRSLHVNVGIYQQKINLYKHYVNLIYGINYDNNDYRFSNAIDFKVNPTGDSIKFDSRQVDGFKRNKLTTRFVTIPVSFRFNFNPDSKRAGHITIGAHAGYRLTSFFKSVSNEDGKRKNYDDFLLNNFRYGAFVKVGVGGITLFGNYVFTPLFREGAGPELYPFSFGLSFSGI